MKRFSVEQVIAANAMIETPFQLDLDNQQHWQVEQVLRIMPGKRMIVRAMAQDGKNTLLKLFFKTRNFQQERNGYKALEKTGVNAPKLFSEHVFAEGGVCCYEFIDNAQSFASRWQVADQTAKTELLEQLLTALQQIYTGGMMQTDLHLDNFIFSGEKLFALDPASCETLRDQQRKIDNLALLVAQFKLRDWPQVSAAILTHFTDIEALALHQSVMAQYKIRTENYLQKIYRECTQVHAWSVPTKKGQHLDIYCEREQCTSTMHALLKNFADHGRDVACYVSTNAGTPASIDILKNGNSSVVSSTIIDEKKIVIKNSRNKNIWRLLRRCLRRSRASNAWYFSHLLQMAGIHVPAPVALVERKLGPFVIESWFVSEFIEGDNLLDVWLYQAPSPQELSGVAEFFQVMRWLQISHGDMKATNLLVKDEKIFVIDYDGMTQHRNKEAAQAALAKDRERFFQNWPQLNLDKLL